MTKSKIKIHFYRPSWIRWPAVCLLVTLLFMDIAQSGWTMTSTMATVSAVPLSLPDSMGRVEAFHRGTNGKLLFYIQDAHQSIEAQKNIARIIKQLTKTQQIKTVFEEGYEGVVPTAWFRQVIPNEWRRKKAAWYLLDHLRLGGAEYAHILNWGGAGSRPPFKLIGADDEKLHQKNIHLYRAVAAASAQTEKDLRTLKNELDRLALIEFSKPFRSWMDLNGRFHRGLMDPVQYLARSEKLVNSAGKNLPEDVFPQISRLLTAVRTQNKQSMDAGALYQEIERFETWMARHFLSPENLSLWNYLRRIRLLEELNTLTLSSPEFETLLRTLPDLGQSAGALTREIGVFIESRTKQPVVLSCAWEKNMAMARKFYRVVEARDRVLERNLNGFAGQNAEDRAVLVYGGFHKRAILQMLEESGWGYAVIEPRIREISQRHENYYRELMTSGRLRGERKPTAGKWVTQERLFNLVRSPEDLRKYLDLNLPRSRAPLFSANQTRTNLRNRTALVSRSEVRSEGGLSVNREPWDELIEIGKKNELFLKLFARRKELSGKGLYSLARTARFLRNEFESIRGLKPNFNAKAYEETVQGHIKKLEQQDRTLVREIEKEFEMKLARANVFLAATAVTALAAGFVSFAAILGPLSLAISIYFPISRNWKINRAPLPRMMLPRITGDGTVDSELQTLAGLLPDLLALENNLAVQSTHELRRILHGAQWFKARLEGLAIGSSLTEDQNRLVMSLKIPMMHLQHRAEDVLNSRTRRLVFYSSTVLGFAAGQWIFRGFPATGGVAGLVYVFLRMKLFDFTEQLLIDRSGYPEAIQRILEDPKRSEMRGMDSDHARPIERFFMRQIEVMNPEGLYRNVHRMATHPEIETNHASFLLDVVNDESARVYIGYGPHGLLMLPSEYPIHALRAGFFTTKNRFVLWMFKTVESWFLKYLEWRGLSFVERIHWQKRWSLIRTEALTDALAEEARRLFFRVHFKIGDAEEGQSNKPSERLAIKPPYAYEEHYAKLVSEGRITPLEFEQELYSDLIKIVQFLLKGGFSKDSLLSLEEFSHLAITQAFLGKYLKSSPTGSAFETSLGEFAEAMPKVLTKIEPGARSEMRSSEVQEAEAVTEAAQFLKQKKWRLPGDTLVYPAAGVDAETIMAFVRARPEIKKVILIDPDYNHSGHGDVYRKDLLRGLTQNKADFEKAEKEKISSGDFNLVSRTLRSEFLIHPPILNVWENSRVVQLELVAQDYLKWNVHGEELPKGAALMIVKVPGDGAFLSRGDRGGDFFYEKIFHETALHGLIYQGHSFLPKSRFRKDNRLELVRARGAGHSLWENTEAKGFLRMPADSYWLLRKNKFQSGREFIENLEKLDYDSIEEEHFSRYLKEVVEVLNAGKPHFFHRFHTYYWLMDVVFAGALMFVDILHALIELAIATVPLFWRSVRVGLVRALEDRNFQLYVRDFHHRHSPAVKRRIVRWLLSRLPDENVQLRQSAMRALLAAGTDSPVLLEGLRLLRDELAPLLDAHSLGMLDRSEDGSLKQLREALYQDYVVIQAARSEVRSGKDQNQQGSQNRAETSVDAHYRLTFPAKVLHDWIASRTKFYAEPLQEQSILRLHLNQKKWEAMTAQRLRHVKDFRERRRLERTTAYPQVFSAALISGGRIVFDKDLRKKAVFIAQGPATLIRVDADTLDIHFSAPARSEVRRTSEDDENPFVSGSSSNWMFLKGIEIMMAGVACMFVYLGLSLVRFFLDSQAGAVETLLSGVKVFSLFLAVGMPFVITSLLLDGFLLLLESLHSWYLARKESGRFVLNLAFIEERGFARVMGAAFGLVSAAGMLHYKLDQGVVLWRAAAVSICVGIVFSWFGAVIARGIALTALLARLYWNETDETAKFSFRDTGLDLEKHALNSKVEFLEFLSVSSEIDSEGWVTVRSGERDSPVVRYKLEKEGFLNVAVTGSDLAHAYELPGSAMSDSVVVGLGVQWQPLIGLDENWIIKLDWNPKTKEIKPVQMMSIQNPLKQSLSAESFEPVRYFSWEANSEEQSLMRLFRANQDFPDQFEDFTHWWKQRRFAQGPVAGLKREVLGPQFIQLEFQDGEKLYLSAENRREVQLVWTFSERNSRVAGALSLEWRSDGQYRLELYDLSGNSDWQFTSRFVKKQGASRLLNAIAFENGHLDFKFLASEQSLQALFPEVVKQVLAGNELKLEDRIRFQGLINRSEVRSAPSVILPLLEEYRSEVSGKNLAQIATILGVTRGAMSQHIKNHPESLAEFKLVKGGRGRPSKIMGLLEKNRNKIAGKTLYEAALILKVARYYFVKFVEDNPWILKEYQLSSQTTLEKTTTFLLEENKRKIRGKNFQAVADIIKKDLTTVSRHFTNHPDDLVKYRIAKGTALKPVGRPKKKQLSPHRRSEMRRTAEMRAPASASLRNIRGRYSVVTDVAAFNALSSEEREEFYKLFEAYQGGQQVKFVFNAATPEEQMRIPRALRILDQRYAHVTVMSMPADKLSFNDEGRRVISVSRKGVQSTYSGFVESRKSARGLLKVRYGLGQSRGGLLAAALMLYETQEPETWKLAVGGFLTEIPGMFKDAISDFLASYIAVGTSA